MVWGFGTVCFGCLDFGFGLLSCSDLWVLFLWFWVGLVYCSCFGVCGCWIAILWCCIVNSVACGALTHLLFVMVLR